MSINKIFIGEHACLHRKVMNTPTVILDHIKDKIIQRMQSQSKNFSFLIYGILHHAFFFLKIAGEKMRKMVIRCGNSRDLRASWDENNIIDSFLVFGERASNLIKQKNIKNFNKFQKKNSKTMDFSLSKIRVCPSFPPVNKRLPFSG